MIPYGRQDITNEDIDAVVSVLKSDFLTQGPAIPRFEGEITRYTGAKHAIAVSNGTAALHIACLAFGLGEGDWLWTSPISFVASANCALYCGAKVDFVDIDSATYNMCPKALEEKLLRAEKENRLPKIVVPVHLTGQPCDMKAIKTLADRFGFSIIEDACHAIGAKYNGNPVGACEYSDITVFSFHPVKIVTTAEGGALTTNNDALAEKIRRFSCHGITRDQNALHVKDQGAWYYEQLELGFNYRLTDIQAALGVSQIQRLESYVAARHEIAAQYNRLLADLPLTLPEQSPQSFSAYHLYVIRLKLGALSVSRADVFAALREANIGVNVHYIPIYQQPYFQSLEMEFQQCPNAEAYYREAISIPMYPGISEEDIRFVSAKLKELLI